MTSEFEAYLTKSLPQIKETYPKAKEREVFGQLRKLFTLACQDLSPARRIAANMLLFPPRLQLDDVYWPSAPEVFKELFQTDLYWPGAGLKVGIPNPNLTQQKRKVLEVEANGISLSFLRQFNPVSENHYQVKFKMEKESPLKTRPDAVTRIQQVARMVRKLNQDSNLALELLEFTARFTLQALETKGFTQRKPFLP